MNCSEFDNNLDDLVDGTLDEAAGAACAAHVAGCDRCAQELAAVRSLQKGLQAWGRTDVPMPDAGFFAAAVEKAAAAGARQHRRRHWLRGFGTALAASLAVLVVTLSIVDIGGNNAIDPQLPTVSMTLEQTRSVNLVFASAEALDDATLTVLLPPGVAMPGFEGRREITWKTSLRAGRNVLPLELVATSAEGGQLLATLSHGGDDRTFRIRLNVS